MPPRTPQYEESIFSHISRGFFFALGFTPAFLLMFAFCAYLFMHLSIEGFEQVRSDRKLHKQVADVIVQTPPMQELKQTIQRSLPVAEIGTSHALSAKEQQEKACNLAILQFSQSNSQSDKNRVNQLCPE